MDFSQDDIDSLLAGGDAAVAEAEIETPAPEPESPAAPAAPETPAAPESSPKASGVRLSVTGLLALEVPVIVKLAEQSMSVLDVTQIKLGTIIEFNLPADSELDLLVNNQRIARGTAVKIGENFGLRVTCIKSPKERIQALT